MKLEGTGRRGQSWEEKKRGKNDANTVLTYESLKNNISEEEEEEEGESIINVKERQIRKAPVWVGNMANEKQTSINRDN